MLRKAKRVAEWIGYVATGHWLFIVGIPVIVAIVAPVVAWLHGAHSILSLALVCLVGGGTTGLVMVIIMRRFPGLMSGKVTHDAIRPVREDTEAIQQAPIIAVEDERWTNLFGRVLILEMKLRIANGSAPFQIVSYTFEGSGGGGAYPSEGAIGEQIRNEIFERQERLGPLIGMVNPNETVLRWVVNGFAPPPPNRGGTPGFVFTIRDATGKEHRMVREPRARLVVPITDAL